MRRQGVGSILFRKLIEEARARDYGWLRITTGAQNRAMRVFAHKFGAHLTFRHGESDGSIELQPLPRPEPARSRHRDAGQCRARHDQGQRRPLADVQQLYGWGRTA